MTAPTSSFPVKVKIGVNRVPRTQADDRYQLLFPIRHPSRDILWPKKGSTAFYMNTVF